MKKRLLILVLVLAALTVVLSGCATEEPPSDEPKKNAYFTDIDENLLEDIRLTVTPTILTDGAQDITTTITNTSDKNNYIFGVYVYLEVLDGGKWVEYPLLENVAWTMEAYLCEPGSTKDMPGHIQGLYGNLPAGRYRIAKDFQLTDSDWHPKETKGYAVAEFEVRP